MPTEGYRYNDDARIKLHINNTTGKDLTNLKIRFKVKKRLVDPENTNAPDTNIVNEIPYFIYGKDSRYVKSSLKTSISDDLYLTQDLNMNTVHQGMSLDMMINLRLSSIHERLNRMLNISDEWSTIRDFDLDYEIINKSDILSTGTMRITLQPSYKTNERSFALQLTRKVISDTSFFTRFVKSQSLEKFQIASEDDRKFWLTIKDTDTSDISGYYSYVNGSNFKFTLPDGVRLDEDTLRQTYKGIAYRLDGKTVTVTVRPKDVGLNLNNKGFVAPYSSYRIYFALPVVIDDATKNTYHFNVDTLGGAFGAVAPLDITKSNFEEVSIPRLFKFTNHNGYQYISGPASKFAVSDVIVTHPKGYDYNLRSIDISTRVPGAILKSVVWNFDFRDRMLKMYGTTASGEKRELKITTSNSNLYWGDLVPTAYDVGYSPNSIRVDVPDDVVLLHVEFAGDDTNTMKTSYICALWDVTDETELLDQSSYSTITYHTDKGDATYDPFVYRGKVKSSWLSYISDVTITQTSETTFINREDNKTLLNYDLSDIVNRMILKLPKDVSIDTRSIHDGYTAHDIIKEEIVGDVKYVLLQTHDGAKIWNTKTSLRYSIPPTFKDGVYEIAMRDYFSGVIGNEKLNGLKFTGNVSFQYDPNKSLKDNFETVTDGSVVTKKLTVNTPKVLSTTTLVNDRNKVTLKNRDDMAIVKSYLVNNSNKVIKNPVMNVDIPTNLELTGPIIVPSGGKVQYQLDDQNYVDSVADYSQVKRYRVVSDANLEPTENIEVTASMRLKPIITSNVNASIKTTVQHEGGTLISGNATIASDLQEFKNGTINVKYVDANGDILKTATATGKHGSPYVIDKSMFMKDGKRYAVTFVENEGSYVGGETKDVIVHMKEQTITFDLPTTGTMDTLITLSGLVGALVITKHKKTKHD